MDSLLNPQSLIEPQKVPSEGCVSFEEFKNTLGKTANDYSDDEIEKIRVLFDCLAEVTFDSWLKKVNSGIIKELS